ncbi:alpha/beta fold hydrolase [Aquimarina sp. 2201CG14-23]|uniref:alpha/beta fold hydrolase n=1 Tax=Aquimarina mycalae TaxID=3040073 RepID=UPI0024782831|nr:alpha/beta hydrolase [Aquimarina sp. 2201CG14-23]MDH7444804.1 alpha/beta hydrolase [Aquimarina sp. 2201CG14-23]
MKLIKKIFKRIFLSFGLLIVLIILAGLVFRLFGPEPHKPIGALVDIDGVKFHVNSTGKKNNKPTLVIEGGGGLSTEYYHWLSEGLKDSLRVVRYDRAGVGYSELSDSPRDLETIAKELHTLLEKTGESPPYILAGHSLGGPYIRVFTQLYPDEVAALVFIDSTHPEQVERFNAAPKSSFRYKSVIWGLNVATFFADVGAIGLLESFTEPIFAGEGLPDEINSRMRDVLLDGKRLRAYTVEMKNYHTGLKRAQKANEFGAIPIRVFTAIEINRASYEERGIDPEKHLQELIEGQKEFTTLSTQGKQILIDGNHQTIFTKKKNAEIICREIIQLSEELKK